MKICMGSDHRGYELKTKIIEALKDKYDITDLGTYSKDAADYTKYAFLVGEKVSNKEYDYGILICGTGIGISIACNKVKGIRCAKVDSVEDARLTRNDNDANVIAISGKTELSKALEIVETFLTTPFSNIERYIKRLNVIYYYLNGDYIER